MEMSEQKAEEASTMLKVRDRKHEKIQPQNKQIFIHVALMVVVKVTMYMAWPLCVQENKKVLKGAWTEGRQRLEQDREDEEGELWPEDETPEELPDAVSKTLLNIRPRLSTGC